MVIVAKLSFLLWADMWYDGGVEKFSVLAESRIWVMGERGKWIVQTAANRTLVILRCVLHAVGYYAGNL